MADSIFISYAHSDGATTAQELFSALKADAFSPWLDTEHGIPPGEIWDDAIADAIKDCRALVFVMTPGSIASEVCHMEWSYAQELKKPIFPLMVITAEVPFRLRLRQYIDFREAEFAGKYPDLRMAIQALETEAGKLQEETLRSKESSLIPGGGATARLVTQAGRMPDLPIEFIGRGDLQKEARDLLDKNRRVVLQGQGGEGKSALAAQIAHTWMQDGKGYVIWLKAGNADATALFEALAEVADATKAMASAQGDAKFDVALQVIDGVQAKLIVLDDVWNGVGLQSLLKGIPRDVPVLITSRLRHPATSILPVPSLSPTEARDLVKLHAGEYAGDDKSVDELCKLLGYLAFVVEIAGKTMQVNTWNAKTLIEQIKDAPHKLELPPEFQSDQRRNVAYMIETSLSALSAETRKVFMAFGAFPEPTLTDIMADIYLKRNDSGKHMTTLVQNGLAWLIPANNESIAYYRIHDLANSYAASLQSDADIEQAITACSSYANRYKEPTLANFKILRAELDNLIKIVSVAMEYERYEDVQWFAWDLVRPGDKFGFLYMQGFYQRAIQILNLGVTAAEQKNNLYDKSAFLDLLGTCYRNLGQYEQTIGLYEQAVAIAHETANTENEGIYLGNLGNAYRNKGDVDDAIEYYEQALGIARNIGDRLREGAWLGGLGLAYYDQGELDRAIEFYEQALEIAHEVGDRKNESNWLNNLGLVSNKKGDTNRAIHYYEQALNIAREIGDKQSEGLWLGNMGITYRDEGNKEKALSYYQQARAIFESITLAHQVAWMDRAIAELGMNEDEE